MKIRIVLSVLFYFTIGALKVALSSSEDICLPSLDSNTPCTTIQSWKEFKKAIYSWTNPNAPLVLCPFAIRKESLDELVLTKSIKVVCLEPRKCKVDASSSGGTNILRVRGMDAKLYMQGMVFEGSGAVHSAVHVSFNTWSKQTFCECDFVRNKGSIRGTALRVEPGGNVDLYDCFFGGNKAADIGSVFNRGTMLIEKCTFQENIGTGGAIGSSDKSVTALKDSMFIANTHGVPLFFHHHNFNDLGGNIAYNNDACDGISIASSTNCIPFPDDGPKPSYHPSSLPSSLPSSKPSFSLASSIPTQIPTSDPETSQPSSESTIPKISDPSAMPSKQQTQRPSNDPETSQPSYESTMSRTNAPSSMISQQPTQGPSSDPETSQPSSESSKSRTYAPSSMLSKLQTQRPSNDPETSQPSSESTIPRTNAPSSMGSNLPTQGPTSDPETSQPSSESTILRTNAPSSMLSKLPTLELSSDPETSQPSSESTKSRTSAPSSMLSQQPTQRPSSDPETSHPSSTSSMSRTNAPSSMLSKLETQRPSNDPETSQPSFESIIPRTNAPSSMFSKLEKQRPSSDPETSQPSSESAVLRTNAPSSMLSKLPTQRPTSDPETSQPSSESTKSRTNAPSSMPSQQLTQKSSGDPETSHPSSESTISRTSAPSSMPSQKPTERLSSDPETSHPSSKIKISTTNAPSSKLSKLQTQRPSSDPETSQPSSESTKSRTNAPSSMLSKLQTKRPSSDPKTSHPSSKSTALKTSAPSAMPSQRPSNEPFSMPSQKPTQIPTRNPETSQSSSESVFNCERVSTENKSCITIIYWNQFKNIVENSSPGEILIFCSFSIMKSNNDSATTIDHDVTIACQMRNNCKIHGASNHILIKGPPSQVFIQGFVFADATSSALRIIKSKTVILCNCHFIDNQGPGRGVGILAERSTNVEIAECKFQNNKSNDMGGSIFNRGQMTLKYSIFIKNIGTGGCFSSALGARTYLKNNKFIDNVGGLPAFFHGPDFEDLGGNQAVGSECNGIFNVIGRKCIEFNENDPLSIAPTQFHIPVTHPPSPAPTSGDDPSSDHEVGGPGYFNYNPHDKDFGPGKLIDEDNLEYVDIGWGNVRDNPEHLRWKEIQPTHKRDLPNVCAKPGVNRRSPIDLCEDVINAECKEHHQTRTHSGNVKFGEQVTAQILPSKLRLKYYEDRTPEGGPYPPEGDFAHHWNGYAEVNHIDVKIPSEHTICGKRFPAEYTIFMLHPKRKETIVMSVLMDFHSKDINNRHFQKAIDEWQKTYDKNEEKCQRRRKRVLVDNPDLESAKSYIRKGKDKIKANLQNLGDKTDIEAPWEYMERMVKTYGKISSHVADSEGTTNSGHLKNTPEELSSNSTMKNFRNETLSRDLQDTTPFGRGGWDPFHPTLETSIYHWGYNGALTEPPCSTFFAYRVLVTPAYISIGQWNQMRNILFNNKGNNCKKTSVDYKGSVARPTQALNDRPLHKCKRSDYVSDAEKFRIRRETGNPYWCC